jgi:glycosyltransferase involved in cell wall biosynthesis
MASRAQPRPAPGGAPNPTTAIAASATADRTAAAPVPVPERPILIDARAAARPELGGVERWAREMAVRLPALTPGAYRVAMPPRVLAHRAGHAWEQLALPAFAAGRRTPLLYCPANLAPLAFPRNVVVVHDVAPLRHPGWYSRAYVAWQRALLPRIVRHAKHVVTVSEFSRRELVDALGTDPARISVVQGGVDERFRPDADPVRARRALGLDRPYVLTVASQTSRKNLQALDIAAVHLAAEGVDLVAAGGARPQFSGEGGIPGVRELGHVSDDDLPGLYAGARAFVLPSRYEGFGLTCVEAMAAGTPVVAAEAGALPETCGDAALYADPDDRDGIAGALLRAVGDGELRERLITAGLKRAAEMTWARAAQETDRLLRTLAAG